MLNWDWEYLALAVVLVWLIASSAILLGAVISSTTYKRQHPWPGDDNA